MTSVRRRKLMRLQGYDYTRSGAYFVTICVKDRVCLFGEIIDGQMHLNPYGEIVQAVWDGLADHYDHLGLDVFVIMPNHIHAIIVLHDDVGAGLIVGAGFKPAPTTDPDVKPAPTGTPTEQPTKTKRASKRHGLPEIVRAFKTFSARRINELRQNPGVPVWQRNYYEHIIRNEESLESIRRYIVENPMRWSEDRENPNNPIVGAGLM
ncbi:transposase [Roseofilum sp. BLCC_M91]|uniref:Transposase n=1 Tax=Roseofilum halophilum BLCC-M91 TaxID=3022259 RepID=A0ABT7BKV7_9CYAN|nr:transposase [Roseofilum halophilum]MDJ1179806.1 transposase [Roseofilum halophilum BLCC-M91]